MQAVESLGGYFNVTLPTENMTNHASYKSLFESTWQSVRQVDKETASVVLEQYGYETALKDLYQMQGVVQQLGTLILSNLLGWLLAISNWGFMVFLYFSFVSMLEAPRRSFKLSTLACQTQ